MSLSRKSVLRLVVLVALALVVATMVVPYHLLQGLLHKFGWISDTIDFIDTVAPGLEASHLIAFATLGFLTRFAWPRARARNVCLAIVAVAVLVEVAQIWVPGRESAVSHAVLEALGGFVGFGIAWVLTFAWGTGSLPDYQHSTHWHGGHSDH